MNPPFPDLHDPDPRHMLDLADLVRRTSDLLASGVPLTLLLDLGEAAGPHSQQHYLSEGGHADWLPRPRVS